MNEQRLQDDGTVLISCANCNKPLLVLQLVKTCRANNVFTRVCAKCMSCDSYSRTHGVVGQFFPGAPNDNISFDVIDNNDPNAQFAPEVDVLFKVWEK